MRTIIGAAILALALTAGAEQKNVKLLTGLSDLELQRTMNLMRASLGVHCDYCHVVKEQWDWASDEKPAKSRARDMIRMVMDVNRGTFDGRAGVSCFTCHRGAIRPVSLATLPQAAPPFPTPVAEKQLLPPARELVAKYAAALGDAARLRSRVLKGERTNFQGPAPIEIVASGARLHVTGDQKFEQIFDGEQGWWRDKDDSGKMSEPGQANFLQLNAAMSPVLPGDIGDDAVTIDRAKVGEREAWVVEKRSGKVRERFFFDAGSGLLVRATRLTSTAVGTMPQQTDFEDYRDSGGTKFPFRVRVSLVDPWAGSTRQYSSVQLDAVIDDTQFRRPE